jgi:hypothetical protein
VGDGEADAEALEVTMSERRFYVYVLEDPRDGSAVRALAA